MNDYLQKEAGIDQYTVSVKRGVTLVRGFDLLLRVNAEESHHGMSGRVSRPVGFKTHTVHASLAG
jgi:hypothetical protein